MVFRVVEPGEKFVNMPRSRVQANRLYRTVVDYGPSSDHTSPFSSWIIRAIKNSRASVNWPRLTTIGSFLSERFSW